jgi:hypothetical protein
MDLRRESTMRFTLLSDTIARLSIAPFLLPGAIFIKARGGLSQAVSAQAISSFRRWYGYRRTSRTRRRISAIAMAPNPTRADQATRFFTARTDGGVSACGTGARSHAATSRSPEDVPLTWRRFPRIANS